MKQNIENISYREKLTIFKVACRLYYKEKEEMQKIEKENPSCKEMCNGNSVFCISLEEKKGHGSLELYQFLKEDISYVDSMFDSIEKKCGKNARALLWVLFVEAETQESVALTYGLTRRQVQYSMDKWMHKVLDDETE